jgi:hypothetical protein
MVRLCGIEEEERVAGRCCVEDDELTLPCCYDFSESAEDSDFFCAGRSKIFFEKVDAFLVETF